MQILAGTSGYAYKEWKGVFYPADVKPAGMLGFYAERLPSVEINNTFYRMPKISVLESWADQVPDGFRFSIKASRRITHFKRLRDTAEELGYLLSVTEALGERLGVLLFQLPPNLKLDLERLDRFLELLPAGRPAAFEFRHPSWREDEVRARLSERGLAWVHVDDEAESEPLVSTADWGYLRLRRPAYDRDELASWAQSIAEQDWSRAFVFFKHEDAGAGPALAAQFLEVAARRATRKPAARRGSASRDRRSA